MMSKHLKRWKVIFSIEGTPWTAPPTAGAS